MRVLAGAMAFAVAVPAAAQDAHHGHDMAQPAPRQNDGAPVGEPAASKADPHAGHAGDGAMAGHSAGRGEMPAAPVMKETPPPAEAGQGPARAADAVWGAEAMRSSRDDLKRMHGDMTVQWIQADRFEYRAGRGTDGFLWDLQAYIGGDIDKLWLKGEGEGEFDERAEQAEAQILWSHAVAPFFDLQAGVRQDFAESRRTYAVVGVQGVAPGMYEVDAALFLSQRGELTGRVEAEIDQRVTQRLILQPRAELNLSAEDIPSLGISAGLHSAELGVRLRYEITREFAPYIGVEREWRMGQSADLARAAGEAAARTHFVMGIRFWF